MSDLISRQNVLEKFEDMCVYCFAYTREYKEEICRGCFIKTVKNIIKESPSVEPKVKIQYIAVEPDGLKLKTVG